jgi:ATP-dependent RNA helicase RhlB
MKFTELNLDERLMRAIQDLGFTDCTDVQAETFKHTLNNRDVAVQSQTGTGKTAAFLISIFQLWITEERYRGTKALVVAPTRELALQIEKDAKDIGKYVPFKSACFYGGVGYVEQERAVREGVDLIIGTPGRLLDFSQSGKLDFRELGILVIDEADRLFDMGFYPDIRKIMRRARPREERVTMLYSATLSNNVRNISWQFMNDPAEIEVTSEQMTVDTVDQVLYHVAKDEKFKLLLGILKESNPETALIFCNTKRATEIVAKKLQLNGYPCEFIMGDLPQKKRIKIIDSMKAGELRMLCATDVAARGLHVDDLDMVINYDIPEDPEAYVHRIGRTARAGKAGRAVSLACERFVYGLEPIQELIGQKIPVNSVSADMLLDDQSAGRHLPTSHYGERPQPRRGGDRRYPTGRQPGRGPGREGAPHGRDDRSPSRSRPAATRPGGPKHTGAPKHAAADTRIHEPAAHQRSAAPRSDSPRQGEPRRNEPRGSDSRSRSGGQPVPERGTSRNASVEDRLAYYKNKYGEDFVPSGSKAANSGSKPSGRDKTKANGNNESKPGDKGEDKTAPKKGLFGRLFGKST